MPGDTQFLDLQADAHMYSNFANSGDGYNCFKDVTSLLQSKGASFNNGEYTVSGIYSPDTLGKWGGWTLIVVYEDVQAATSKKIYIYENIVSLNLLFLFFKIIFNFNNIKIYIYDITGLTAGSTSEP